MPTEAERKTKVKRVSNPDDPSTFVPVPVITQISFTDQKTFGQEYGFILDNTETNNARKVKVVTGIDPKTGKGGVTDPDGTWKDGSSRLAVERIKQFFTRDQKTFGQDYGHILDNDGDDPGPHKKVHTRYWTFPRDAAMPDPTKEPTGADAWIQVEQIDQLDLTDQKSFGQEQVYILNNPTDGSDIPTDDGEDIPDDKKSTLIDPPWRLDPFQNVVDVRWEPKNFVITGLTGNLSSTGPSPPRYIIYSNDGVNWTQFAGDTTYLPFCYGGGVWIGFNKSGSPAWSKDIWKTWTPIVGFGTPIFICYGVPKTAPPGAPNDANGKPIRKGTFVAMGNPPSNINNIVLSSSIDKGVTWAINKTITTTGNNDVRYGAYGNGFLTFLNGIFYFCSFGINNSTDQNPIGFGGQGMCTLWQSTDGATWDNGTSILANLCGKTWGSELGFTDPLFVRLNPLGMVRKTAGGTQSSFVISGTVIFGGSCLFYAEANDPIAFTGQTVGNFAEFESTIWPPPNGHTSDTVFTGPSNGAYWRTNNPTISGGFVAATKNSSIITAYSDQYDEITVTFDTASPFVFPKTTAIFLNVTSDKEGVLSPTFSETYFCGGTVTTVKSPGTDRHGNVVTITVAISELNTAAPGSAPLVAAKGFKQPNSPDSSPGTFVWVRQFLAIQSGVSTFSNRGIEVRWSSDGTIFTKAVLPTGVAGANVYLGGLAQGATPPKPTTQ